jgi:bifunctional chitinase/lysozyme
MGASSASSCRGASSVAAGVTRGQPGSYTRSIGDAARAGRVVAFGMLLALLACTSVTCGPGTVLVDSTCVVDDPSQGLDTGASDTGAPDTGAPDTGAPDTADTGDTAPPDTGDTAEPADDGWPARFFAPYVDATAYPTLKVGELPAATGTRYVTLAFVVAAAAGDCTATWGTYYDVATGPSAWEGGAEYTLYEQIEALRAQGGDVMVSFGGAANTPLEAACDDVDALVAEVERVIDALDLTRIDFDVEGPWLADRVSTTRRSQAIAALKARHPGLHVWYTLPVLPTGLTADGVHVLQDALDHGADLDGVNVMTMDYGAGAAPDPAGRMGEYGIAAIEALHAQLDTLHGGARTEAELWAGIGSTPMIGQNDVAGEWFDLDDARETLVFADAHGVGMLGMWSVNRDRSCPEASAWARSDCHGLTDLPAGAYARVFTGLD